MVRERNPILTTFEPPTGWVQAVARLARQRGIELISLADRLEQVEALADDTTP